MGTRANLRSFVSFALVAPVQFAQSIVSPGHGGGADGGPTITPVSPPPYIHNLLAIAGALIVASLVLWACAFVARRVAPRRLVHASDLIAWSRLVPGAFALAFGVGAYLHFTHVGAHEAAEMAPLLHWVRDSLLAVPSAIFASTVAALLAVWLQERRDVTTSVAQLLWALGAAMVYSALLAPGALLHGWMFQAEHEAGASLLTHAAVDATTAAPVVLAAMLLVLLGIGTPFVKSIRGEVAALALGRAVLRWSAHPALSPRAAGVLAVLATVAAAVGVTPVEGAFGLPQIVGGTTSTSAAVAQCTAEGAVRAYDVAAVNAVIPFNRWGDVNRHGQVFVLQQDKAAVTHWAFPTDGSDPGAPASDRRLRPRPLVLRANAGECIRVTLTNELGTDAPVPAAAPPAARPDQFREGLPAKGTQRVSLHVHGAAYNVQQSDGSMVGYNGDSTVASGASMTYLWRAPAKEGLYFFHDHATLAGSEADGGSNAHGLYGALAVEPAGSKWYDPTSGLELSSATPGNQYRSVAVAEQSGDLYVSAMIKAPGIPTFRELVQISQDELPGTHLQNCDFFVATGKIARRSACQNAGADAVAQNGIGFDFGLGLGFNYSEEHLEVRAALINRCPDCVSEETWLNSWPYGDPGLVKLGSGIGPWYPVWHPFYPSVDSFSTQDWLDGKPQQNFTRVGAADPEADCGLPDTVLADTNGLPTTNVVPTSCYTASVARSYNGDPTKVRFAHAGPKETHIFHLHAHQWLADPFDVGLAGANPSNPGPDKMPQATTIDSQTYGPGEAFTADMLFSAGSKNLTPGDAIFHCHLYPHFAEGFWALWRVHDRFEDGSGRTPDDVRVARLARLPENSIAAPDATFPGFPRFIPGEHGWRAPQPPGSIWEPNGNADNPTTSLIREDLDPAIRMVAGQALHADYLKQVQVVTKRSDEVKFTLTYGGKATGAIDPADPAVTSNLAAALNALGVPGVYFDVTGAASSWTVTFRRTSAPTDPRLALNIKTLLVAQGVDESGPVGDTVVAAVALTGNPTLARLTLEDKNTGGTALASRDKAVIPGAPVAEPCPSAAREVNYNATVLQTNIVYNEQNWHDTQGRFYVLTDDVPDILAGENPEPFFFRVNAGDCINFALNNDLPNWIGNDDFLKLSQTNMIGQHIHLVKFDVLASDGSSNGWNYTQAAFTEDQFLFNQSVRDQTPLKTTESKLGRTGWFRHYADSFVAGCGGDIFSYTNGRLLLTDDGCRIRQLPASGPATYSPTWSCQAGGGCPRGQTIRERWFADYQLRTVFTHDHHFPAIDQNRGLFAALVVEPAEMDVRNSFSGVYYQPINAAAHGTVCGSIPLIPAENALLTAQGREPTSHKSCTATAAGTHLDIIGPGVKDDFREYSLAIHDFVPLYRPCSSTGAQCPSTPSKIAGEEPLQPPADPEVFPAADPGVFGLNYRNAPMVLRNTRNGAPVDPAYWFSSVVHGDPRTPILRAYGRDPIRVRLIQGAQEEQHVVNIHGMRWLDEPDDPGSPLVNSRALGISEAFNFEVPTLDCGDGEDCRGDYLYSGSSSDDLWLGAWGILRVFGKSNNGLLPLPDNIPGNSGPSGQLPQTGSPPPMANKPGTPCPTAAPIRVFNVIATDASITYNEVLGSLGGEKDPYGLVYALQLGDETPAEAAARVRSSNPEPLVLHANTGDCIEVTLSNAIDPTGNFARYHAPFGAQQSGTGFDPPLPLETSAGTRAGMRVSLHPSLVKYDVRGSDGATIGFNRDQTVGVGQSILYRWWADGIATGELGAINLTDYGDFRGHRHHGLFAGLVVHPTGATVHDPRTGAPLIQGAVAERKRADDLLVVKGKDSPDQLTAADRQTYYGYLGEANRLASGNQADVRIGSQADYRNWTLFHQDGLNLWDRDVDPAVGGAAKNVPDAPDHPAPAPGEVHSEVLPATDGQDAAGLPAPPEAGAVLPDSEDRGEKGYNYRNAPFHVRLGINLHSPFVPGPGPFDGLDGTKLAHVFSSLPSPTTSLDRGDPKTPIFRAYTGDPLRIRLLQGSDKPRQQTFNLSSHAWYRQPFDDLASTELIGLIGGMSVGRAINIHAVAGGALELPGDYRYGSNNLYHHQSGGLWGIARIYTPPTTSASTFVPDQLQAVDNPYTDGYQPLMRLEMLAARVTVFDDVNMNGLFDKAEVALGKSPNGAPEIEGVEVELYAIGEASGEPEGPPIGPAVKTDATGVAEFYLTPGGSYAAKVKLPELPDKPGKSDWQASKLAWAAFNAGTQSEAPSAQIGIVQLGDASVNVFRDIDGDAKIDAPDDAPAVGWSVTLKNGTFSVTKTTADGLLGTVAGEALFEGLLPGDYTVEVVAQEGRKLSSGAPKSVKVGENKVGAVDVGFTLEAGLTVTLFNDADNDGTQDGSIDGLPEVNLSGWKVQLYADGSADPIATATTNAAGQADFGKAQAGPKTIKVVPPRGTPTLRKGTAMETPPAGTGSPKVLCDNTCEPDGAPVGLLEGWTYGAVLAVHLDTAWVGPDLFNDTNNNGKRDGGEQKLVGWGVKLYAPSTTACPAVTATTPAPLATAVTGNDGRATFPVDFTGVGMSKTYLACVTQPADADIDWRKTPATLSSPTAKTPVPVTVQLLAGETKFGPLGLLQLGTIQAQVFDDTDANGVDDEYDGRLAGRTVRLRNRQGNTILAQKATNSGGMASFPVSTGTEYQLEVLLPTGWAATVPLASNGRPTTITRVVSSSDAAQSVVMPFGQTNTTGAKPSLPMATPAAGSYTGTQQVALASSSGATIYYTTNGADPTTSSAVYTTPIEVASSLTVKAVAVNSFGSSGIATFAYTITVPTSPPGTPVASPAPGTYSAVQSVTLTSAGADSIRYTTDGTVPTAASTLYSGPISVGVTTTISAIGVNGVGPSPVGTFAYTISLAESPPSTPTASPVPGNYGAPQSVVLTSTSSVAIRYTTNGSDPTTSSTLYAGPIAVGTSMTIKAIGINASGVTSPVATFAYVIGAPAPSTATPTPWDITRGLQVSVDGNTTTDNGAFLVVASERQGNQQRIQMDATGAVSSGTVAGVSISYSGSATVSGVSRTIRLWNDQTSAFETVNALASELTGDGAAVAYQVSGDASRFVSTGGTRSVRVRIETQSETAHQLRLDYVAVTVTYK